MSAGSTQDTRTSAAHRALAGLASLLSLPLPEIASADLVFFRVDVYVSEEAESPIASGDEIEAGQELFLEFQGPEPAYVYVFDESAEGDLYLLFPTDPNAPNPLFPAVPAVFPRRASSGFLIWPTSNASGRETILVLASRGRLAAFDRALGDDLHAARNPSVRYARCSTGTLEALPWLGHGVLAAQPPGTRLVDVADRLPRETRSHGGIWAYVFHLAVVP